MNRWLPVKAWTDSRIRPCNAATAAPLLQAFQSQFILKQDKNNKNNKTIGRRVTTDYLLKVLFCEITLHVQLDD